MTPEFDIFLVATPGLEKPLADEAREKGFTVVETIIGGVTLRGGWPDVWRANLVLRGATRVLARIGEFRAMHLAQLDKRSRKFPWGDFIPHGAIIRVDTTCRKSRIYHAGAAAQRIEKALREEMGATIAKEASISIKVRIEDDLCTISLDTSGPSLHKRGHKHAVNKAPMRETLAALFLRECGYVGTETVYDPMCGSGTFVIEAAEIARNLAPGRDRAFAFEQLPTFDAKTWDALRAAQTPHETPLHFYGSDRDTGAIGMSEKNAASAGLEDITTFTGKPISDITPPDAKPGLVIVNPPYGGRIGDKKPLFGLYGAMGARLMDKFRGWRVGIITTEAGLAKATGLPFLPVGPIINHGGLKVRLYQTKPLA